jgi:hypothetical protein
MTPSADLQVIDVKEAPQSCKPTLSSAMTFKVDRAKPVPLPNPSPTTSPIVNTFEF